MEKKQKQTLVNVLVCIQRQIAILPSVEGPFDYELIDTWAEQVRETAKSKRPVSDAMLQIHSHVQMENNLKIDNGSKTLNDRGTKLVQHALQDREAEILATIALRGTTPSLDLLEELAELGIALEDMP